MTLYLIRHGQTAYNLERRFLGRTDLCLDEVGREQARRLGLRMRQEPWDRLYSSPLLRARETAEQIGVPTLVDGMMEMDMGELEGLSREEMDLKHPGMLEHWFADPGTFRPPGGETMEEAQDRAWEALHQLVPAPGTTVVVTHQLVLAGILCRIVGEPIHRFRKLSHGNTGISVLEWENGGLKLRRLNDVSHLD